MAASATTIAMTLVANTMRFDRKMRKSRKQIKGIGDQSKRTGRNLKAMAVPVKALAGAFVALGAARVAERAFLSIGKRAEGFNQAMLSSLAIMGDVSDALKKEMTQAAFDAAAATRFASKDIAGSFFFLASAGLKAEQQIAALPLVTKFAQAGMFELQLATDLLTDAQSALGLTVKDAQKNLSSMTRVADVLVKANTLANASVVQFSQALTSKAAAAMRFLNIRVEEGVAVLAAFADQGLKAGDAGTAFNIVTRDLTTKAIKNAAAFERMNIAVFDASGRMNNMADIIRDLERALDGMNARQAKATILALGFADKSSIFIQTLIGMSGRIREYEQALDQAGGTTQEVADKQLTNLRIAVNKLDAAWTKLTTTIGITDPAASGVSALATSVALLNDIVATLSKEADNTGFSIVDLGGFLAKTAAVIGISSASVNKSLKPIKALIRESVNARKQLLPLAAAAQKVNVNFKRLTGGLGTQARVSLDLARANEVAQAKLIDNLEKQAALFGKSAREIALYNLALLNATSETVDFANALFDQMDAAKRGTNAVSGLEEQLRSMKDAVADFGLSETEKMIKAFMRTFTGAVVPKALFEKIRRAAAALDTLRDKADAFATLKQQALSLARSLRTPQEELADTIALLNKMAKTIDPATGKALIDTDTLNRGLQKARDQLRRLKDDVRGFAQGKRETTGRLNEVILGNIAKGVAAQRAKNARGNPLFRQFGPTPPGGILQGGPPNLFGRATMRPGTMSGNTVTITRNDQLEDIRGLLDKVVRQGQVVRAA